ncbi:MAG: hypothetical protein IJ761_05225 [Bacteroidales bacterium]|nr:hypothetical protein [Bacteroidales bacterium]
MRTTLFWLLLLTSMVGQAQNGLFERYASQSGVRVAEVERFPIDSALTVGVTIVEAQDSAGWQWMKEEFLIGDLMPAQTAQLRRGSDVVLFTQRHRQQPMQPAPIKDERVVLPESCYMVISYLSRTVFFFMTDTEAQNEAIVALLVRKIMRSQGGLKDVR